MLALFLCGLTIFYKWRTFTGRMIQITDFGLPLPWIQKEEIRGLEIEPLYLPKSYGIFLLIDFAFWSMIAFFLYRSYEKLKESRLIALERKIYKKFIKRK